MEIVRPWSIHNANLDMIKYIDQMVPDNKIDIREYTLSIQNIILESIDIYKSFRHDDFILQKLFEFDSDITSPDSYDILAKSLMDSKAHLFITYWNNSDDEENFMDYDSVEKRSPRLSSDSDYDHVEAILVFKKSERATIISETPSTLSIYNSLYTEIKSKGKYIQSFTCDDFKPFCLDVEQTTVVALMELQRKLDQSTLSFVDMNITINTNTMFMSSASTNIIIIAFN